MIERFLTDSEYRQVVIIVFLLFIGVICIFIMMARSIFGQKKTIAKIYESEHENEDISDEIAKQAEGINARVMSKRMDIVKTGTAKKPGHYRACYMTFLKENGEEQEYSVPEAVFEQFEADVEGILVTDKGVFIDYVTN